MKGNTHTAKIFLDTKNSTILDKELQANFGTTLGELRTQDAETEEIALRIQKTDLPQLQIMQLVRRVVPLENTPTEVQFSKPTDVQETPAAFRSILTPDFTQRGASPLTALGTQDEVEITNRNNGLLHAGETTCNKLSPLCYKDPQKPQRTVSRRTSPLCTLRFAM